MARIRTLKPEFFLDEDLATVSPAHRLLFAGLWTLADRKGRLEDSPMRIKAQLFPYEEMPVDLMLGDLHELGPIQRYEVDGLPCIAIPNFGKHQRPHPKEVAADLPDPPSREKKRLAKPNLPSIPSSPAGKGREGDLGSGKESWEGNREPEKLPSTSGPPTLPVEALPIFNRRSPTSPLRAVPLVEPPPPGDFRDRMEAQFKAQRGGDYDWKTADDNATGALLGQTRAGEEEIHRRWAIGLRRPGYPACNSLSDLSRHWNAYAKDAATGPPQRPKDVTRGTVRAEDQAGLHAKGGQF